MNFELTENERLLLIFALGHVHNAIVMGSGGPPAKSIELAGRLANFAPDVKLPEPATPAPPPAVTPAPPKRQEIPEGAIELRITPTKIVKVGSGEKERLLVKWMDNGTERLANCWAQQKALWPRVLACVKQPCVLYAKQSGIYINIVGVQ